MYQEAYYYIFPRSKSYKYVLLLLLDLASNERNYVYLLANIYTNFFGDVFLMLVE